MRRVLFVLIVLLAFSSAAWAQKGDPTPISKIDIPAPCADFKPCLQEPAGVVVVQPGKGKVPPIQPAPIDQQAQSSQATKPGPVSYGAGAISGSLLQGPGTILSPGRPAGDAITREQETRRSLKRLIRQLG